MPASRSDRYRLNFSPEKQRDHPGRQRSHVRRPGPLKPRAITDRTCQPSAQNCRMSTITQTTVVFSCPKCGLSYQATQEHSSDQNSGSFDCKNCKTNVLKGSVFMTIPDGPPSRNKALTICSHRITQLFPESAELAEWPSRRRAAMGGYQRQRI